MATTNPDELDLDDDGWIAPRPRENTARQKAMRRKQAEEAAMSPPAATPPPATMDHGGSGPLDLKVEPAVGSTLADPWDNIEALAVRINEMRSRVDGDVRNCVGSRPSEDGGFGKLAEFLNKMYREGVEAHLFLLLRLGFALLHAKQAMKGRFMDWVRENCRFSYSSASNYMKLATNWEVLVEKYHGDLQRVGSLSLREALAILAVPPLIEALAKPDVLPPPANQGSTEPPPQPGSVAAVDPGRVTGTGPATRERPEAEVETDLVESPTPSRASTRPEAKTRPVASVPEDEGPEHPVNRGTSSSHDAGHIPAKHGDSNRPLAPPCSPTAGRIADSPGLAGGPDPARPGPGGFALGMDLLNKVVSAPDADRPKLQDEWTASHGLRERLSILLFTDDLSEMFACKGCDGVGTDGLGRVCDACQGLRLDVGSEVEGPSDHAMAGVMNVDEPDDDDDADEDEDEDEDDEDEDDDPDDDPEVEDDPEVDDDDPDDDD